ncbi:hypothetical protein MKX01_015278 [Papaver californicum]|nr:hypothetical protein MKX01_015278 [Papaver californicum]
MMDTSKCLHFWGNSPELEEEHYGSQNIKASKNPFIPCYGNDISWTLQYTTIFLAQMGFACFALDIEGHGQSQGLKAFVPNVDLVVDDSICLIIHFKDPKGFNGAILVAPMCKISDNVKPKWPVPEILTFVAKFMPTLAIVPTADLLDKSIKVEKKRLLESPVSRAIYEEAKSEDKSLKIYDGIMHSLMYGETDEHIGIIRQDIV